MIISNYNIIITNCIFSLTIFTVIYYKLSAKHFEWNVKLKTEHEFSILTWTVWNIAGHYYIRSREQIFIFFTYDIVLHTEIFSCALIIQLSNFFPTALSSYAQWVYCHT